jgi:hypothetical protein
MRLYIDGELAARKLSQRVKFTNRGEYRNDDIHLGALWNGQYNFVGVLDEVFIFRRALSREEVKALLKLTEFSQ